MKIAFFETEDWEADYMRNKLKGNKIKFFDEILTKSKVRKIKDIDALAVFVHSDVDKEILDELTNLKLIVTMSTGYDHIDLEECKKRGIKVCNVPDYAENTVAEHTFALILSLSRKICQSWDDFRKGKQDEDELIGVDLKGKTLGVIGVGKIGKRVVKMAKAFEMNVIAYDVVKNFNVKYVSLDYLLRNSDIVSLHCPLNEHTEYLMNKKNISKMKKGALFINTARGKLVDTIALAKALKEKKLRGIGIDVLENEEEIKEEPEVLVKKTMHKSKVAKLESSLLKLNNVIITPHNAFNSEESILRLMDETVDNIKSFKRGKVMNCVKAA
ncbi:MAG: hydroxyacid dehydrogenase [Nanoarchaeota archaeon]|nr:hydroxyacid dehydrogenase [Nanoarchaeota archaeon]